MRKSIIKNISLGIACLLAVGGSIAAASAFNADKPFVEVHADADSAIEYISRSWDDTNKEVVDTSSTCQTYTVVTPDTTSWTDGGWYVVSSAATIESRVNVAGTANLILCDGATLTVNNGISVNGGNTLNIYGQSEGTGSIVATTSSYRTACIGGNEDSACGTISIHGGTITATGPTTTAGPGIGGGFRGDGGSITIYGGNITANGGRFAPAIGGDMPVVLGQSLFMAEILLLMVDRKVQVLVVVLILNHILEEQLQLMAGSLMRLVAFMLPA